MWPDDADGAVLKSMQARGFDFSKPCTIDFNVDFDAWPPSQEAIRKLESEFPGATVYEPTNEFQGYVQFQVHALLSYELVMRVQYQVTELMAPFGGYCESWGVLH